jgi:tRNA G18 (ribose-2'-O)-methylase SpoU
MKEWKDIFYPFILSFTHSFLDVMRKLTMAELDRLSVEQFWEAEKRPYVLVLDNVRSLLNVGSIFRTADAFRCEKIYLCGITGTPPHRELAKTALGADETVPWQYAPDAAELVSGLRREGVVVAVVEQTDRSQSLALFQPEAGRRYAFVLGNEVSGVSDGVVGQADLALEIPQFGTKHSLNVAVAAGIVCWDFMSKLLSGNGLSV